MKTAPFAIARLLCTIVCVALVLALLRFYWAIGIVAGTAILACWFRKRLFAFGHALAERMAPGLARLKRPAGRPGIALVTVMIATVPAILFFDPYGNPFHRGHIPRDPLEIYSLFSDDVAYISASLTWDRTLANLFVPHNTHIVPAWRLVTWALVCAAGSLARIPEVLAVASYAILVAVMFLTGRLVARETGLTSLGLAAMVLAGTSSLLLTPVMWYSAGQPLWAGLGILFTLWYAQSYRQSGNRAQLVFAALSAPVAGWFWTIGHLAGPVAAIYLWLDGRRRCRLGSLVPLAATALAVALSFGLGGKRIDSTISFHGRTVRSAARPVQGVLYTLQAIPENLIFANLGLTVHTTEAQGMLLTLGLALLWSRGFWPRSMGQRSERQAPGRTPGATSQIRPRSAQAPLECAGAALVVGSYLIEWTVRGYMDYEYLRTINLYFIVPWYDAIPQLGAVLFVAGWWGRSASTGAPRPLAKRPQPATWLACLAVGVLAVVLIALNGPRVDALIKASVPPLMPVELKRFPIPKLHAERANYLLMSRASWQRAYLRRLERCEQVARRLGLGRDEIRAAFGEVWIPASVSRLRPSLYELYDAVAVLDLPAHGRPAGKGAVAAALGEFFAADPEPRPGWLYPGDPWPPPSDLPISE